MQASDFQEGNVFLDTNFFYHFLRTPSEYKHQKRNLTQRRRGAKSFFPPLRLCTLAPLR